MRRTIPTLWLLYPDDNRDLSFRMSILKYDPHSLRKTIDDVSFTVPGGKVTAIVGTSGSGKTTLIKLLLGYYPVSGGKICIGNTPISELNLKWWRRQCGVVMQDGVVFLNRSHEILPWMMERLMRAVTPGRRYIEYKSFIMRPPLEIQYTNRSGWCWA